MGLTGLRQEDALSATLFNIVFKSVIRKLNLKGTTRNKISRKKLEKIFC